MFTWRLAAAVISQGIHWVDASSATATSTNANLFRCTWKRGHRQSPAVTVGHGLTPGQVGLSSHAVEP